MNPIILYLIDDKEEARWANVYALQQLLGSSAIKVIGKEPPLQFSDYNALLADQQVKGFFIDQRMRGGGTVNYNGTELAEYLRGHNGKLPIYVLTGYPNDDFTGTAYRVEDIVDKEDIECPESDKAKTLRARILRRLAVFDDVLNEREQCFHDLLLKSMREPLSKQEEHDLGILEAERMLPFQAIEIRNSKDIERAITELKAKLQKDTLDL